MVITHFTCHAMIGVSCGSTMYMSMALKTGTRKLRRSQPSSQLLLFIHGLGVFSGTSERDTSMTLIISF